ncbi:hypothetical protein G7Y89_g5420 [Cudoniella acicularis]|uniref:NCT transcriptional regulatory complex subunit A n=1 Tax=Cudoniella acicularis TaxID=354080 RepID=A0A8H4W3T7_9HELO|nr:hypothetical protein G7Y89_g5420 [Cudoniella acicularis]
MDSTYAPQSPDLSSFLPSPSKQPQPYQPTSTSSYAPRSPVLSAYNTNPQQHHQTQSLHAYQSNQQSSSFGGATNFGDYNAQYMPPIPALPPSHSFSNSSAPAGAPSSSYYAPPGIKTENYSSAFDGANDYTPSPTTTTNMSARAARQPRNQASSSSSNSNVPPQYKNPNPNNIEIKTKFPVARIKRIMQADEEVGKVAQVTPVAVSKALELFMISLVSGAAEKAKEKGGKRVTAQHLKAVVLGSPEQFDFLADIVGRVSEAQEGAGGEGRKRKEKVEGSESEEEEAQKKPKKGKGRRKKSDD